MFWMVNFRGPNTIHPMGWFNSLILQRKKAGLGDTGPNGDVSCLSDINAWKKKLNQMKSVGTTKFSMYSLHSKAAKKK